MADPAPLTLGTAGHIDHGKTALVAALTGHETDRLPEERRRGISIALGYAPLTLPSGRSLSVVDVPGHERLVRTMVAGATGIDLFLLVVAADDGVMPQTREHLAVLAALGVGDGVVAVTKVDRRPPDRAVEQARALLGRTPVVPVSARTGEGLDRLRRELERCASGLPGRAGTGGVTRLHVDRVFTVRGAGTVVTGTLWAGELRRGATLTVIPASGHPPLPVRVRALQVHDRPCERAAAGQRVAVNLTGVARSAVARGDVLVAEGADAPGTFRLDCALAWVDEDRRPASGDRVTVHHGTRESPARTVALGGRFWQLRLERPISAEPGDRVVVRAVSPPDTLGGGRVLDADPARHGPSRALTAALTGRERGQPPPSPVSAPAAPAPRVSPPEPTPVAPGPVARAAEVRLREAGLRPPPDAELAEPGALAELRNAGRAVRLGRDMHLHVEAAAEAERRIRDLALARGGRITLAELRDELATSRRYAQALLEHLDGARVLRRDGDVHVLRPRAPGRP